MAERLGDRFAFAENSSVATRSREYEFKYIQYSWRNRR